MWSWNIKGFRKYSSKSEFTSHILCKVKGRKCKLVFIQAQGDFNMGIQLGSYNSTLAGELNA